MGSHRTPRGAMIVAGLLLLLLGLSPSASASAAADAYKYWGYYHSAGSTWEFSLKGADQYIPKDGSVEGWRYGLDVAGTRFPRTVPAFDTICAGTAPDADEKAVAVVIDYGTADEAENGDVPPQPRGECVEAAKNATGLQVLQEIAEATVDGFVLAIDGYPSQPPKATYPDVKIPSSEPTVELALADADADGTAAADSEITVTDDDDGFPWAIVSIGAIALLLGAAALVMARRRA